MTGAESLVHTLVNGGVEVCFANPGTSEMHFMVAADKVPGMRTILGLFEGVCTGAADGYARMAEKPAATLTHLGPGFGNAYANAHNARRGFSPMVNIIGDHATYHIRHNAPLTTDIETMAKTVSDWVRTSRNAADIPKDAAKAVLTAMTPPGQVATLILPADCSWNESPGPAAVPEFPKPEPVASETVDAIAKVLRKKEPTVLLLASPFILENALWQAGRIAGATGARIIGNRSNRKTHRGAGRVPFDRIPYPVAPALKLLEGTAHMILVGAKPPVSFFAWRNMPNWLTPENCRIHTLATPQQDGFSALKALADALGAPGEPVVINSLKRPALPTGTITPEKAWHALAALMPENSVIVDEGVTSSRDADGWLVGAPPHDWIGNTGGAIGFGMPVATGAAVACPDRKVFSMEADGSAMYTLQSLWTQAHENLDVVTVLFSNRSYKILLGELERVGIENASPTARAQFELTPPDLNWIKLANGMGVPAERAETAEDFNKYLEAAIASSGPHLIEVVL